MMLAMHPERGFVAFPQIIVQDSNLSSLITWDQMPLSFRLGQSYI